jgi:hypothetical protein
MDAYICPNCGNEEKPVESVQCAERITYYDCSDPECDYSSWDLSDYEVRELEPPTRRFGIVNSWPKDDEVITEGPTGINALYGGRYI